MLRIMTAMNAIEEISTRSTDCLYAVHLMKGGCRVITPYINIPEKVKERLSQYP